MTENWEITSKVAIPAISLIIAFAAALKNWVKSKQARFEEREKLSKHAYELYQISGDEKLKNLSMEYGYAAITKDSFLTIHQRKALVESNNPVKDIESYIRCREILDIKIEPLKFVWKKNRLGMRWYYNLVFSLKVFMFWLGVVILVSPVILILFSEDVFNHNFLSLPLWQSTGVVAYCEVMGFLMVSLSTISIIRLTLASGLIKRHL